MDCSYLYTDCIGFCKDFSTFASGNEPFVKSILVSVHNIASKFDTPFDAQERGFYKELASLTDAEIVSKIIEVAHYYKDEY